MPARLALVALCLAPLCACAVRTPPEPESTTPSTARDAAAPQDPATRYHHPFPPAELVVHPLTRLITDPDDGDPRIEAHFELTDRYGHTVKALGTASLELRANEPGTGGAGGGPRQLARWTIDMSTPDANARPFDRVTRTYRLTLVDLPPNLPDAQTLTLGVRYTTNQGVRLSGERRLERER